MAESRIKILPDDLINKIAAGEVVERPASVVKELLENSIDAGATRISIEVSGAGGKLIRVSDNGSGLTGEEIPLALERHSTSKIGNLDDLFNIKTLGFRGEALPSIAGVSKIEILSCREGRGNQLQSEGGKTIKLEAAGCPVGTTIIVKDLFFNTPARRKFLKSPAVELGHINDIVSKYVLACPGIAFELISEGKPLVKSTGSGKLSEAIMAVYGLGLMQELIEGQLEFKSGKVYGFISRPTLSRMDKSYENFFVNRRYVRNFLLNRALEEAYRTLIPGGRYPVAVLFIDIDPKLIDVNVHPTKREIKFQSTSEVMQAVSSMVTKTLSEIIEAVSWDKGVEAGSRDWKLDSKDQLPISSFEAGIPEIQVTSIQPFIPIYQYKQTYIISTDGKDLVLIDQHAAHERILYDKLSQKAEAIHSQPLLTPENLELGPQETAILQENVEYLKSLGFELEEFGSSSYLIRAVPALSIKSPAQQLLRDILAELSELGKTAQLEIKQENIRKLIACHSAIKAGDKLSIEEMNRLIRDLYATENPATCPHGRPTLIRLTEEEFKKRFGR